jgi:hypothetical protein
MDGVTLLQRARDAGLRLEVADTSLKISGPKKAEALVRLLAEHKARVLDALQKVQEVQQAPGKENNGTERDASPYAFALESLRANCPPEDRWRQAIADATAFISESGAQALAFGWTEQELFGLHPVPEQPAANYSRLSRLDSMGLIWLIRGRPVVMLTATEAVMRCPSGAALTYRKQNAPGQQPTLDYVGGLKP